MALLDIFKKKPAEPLNPRVLVCSVGDGFDAFISEDAATYKRFLPNTIVMHLSNAEVLLSAAANRYEIMHAFVSVDEEGHLAESTRTGTELIDAATRAGTKLLWIANGNNPKGYIQGFKAKGTPINLVMTIDRNGPKFPDFLYSLLREMKYGASMPTAWNALAPQIPGREHNDTPASIFFCGLGQARFI